MPRSGPALVITKVATEIRDLIESARSHVSATANLAMVSLYWNIGRVITQEIQRDEIRAGYGATLIERLASILTEEYGNGFSGRNLWDMKRFFVEFQILQPLSAESGVWGICQPLANELSSGRIVQPVAGELQAGQICQTPSGKLARREILQTPSAESSERLVIDFRKHFRLGWSHYRLLLSRTDLFRRKFYFEQAAQQRWSVREFRRQIDRGLFERVALSKDTSRLVAQEEQAGPAEIARYEEIFKDPYVLDFLGLKGAYSEKDLEASYMTHLPDKRLLEDRLKVYSRLLKDRKHRSAE